MSARDKFRFRPDAVRAIRTWVDDGLATKICSDLEELVQRAEERRQPQFASMPGAERTARTELRRLASCLNKTLNAIDGLSPGARGSLRTITLGNFVTGRTTLDDLEQAATLLRALKPRIDAVTTGRPGRPLRHRARQRLANDVALVLALRGIQPTVGRDGRLARVLGVVLDALVGRPDWPVLSVPEDLLDIVKVACEKLRPRPGRTLGREAQPLARRPALKPDRLQDLLRNGWDYVNDPFWARFIED